MVGDQAPEKFGGFMFFSKGRVLVHSGMLWSAVILWPIG